MSRFALLAACLFALAAPSSRAGAPSRPAVRPLDLFDVGAPSFANFSTRDGLPDSVVVAIRTDRDGFVWAGSPDGVFRYDGRRWTPSEDPSMAHSVDSLAIDADGVLWAAFRDHGIARYDGAQWHADDATPSRQVRRFAEMHDAEGHPKLWAATWDQGLMILRDRRWVLDARNGELPRGPVLSLAETHSIGGEMRQWAGTGNNGLWFRERGGAWQRFRAEGFDPGQVEFLYPTTHAGREELWISVFSQGVWRLTEDGLAAWTHAHGDLPTDDVYDIAETPLPDGDRAIWVASRAGLIRIHDERARAFDRRHGLPSNAVRGLGEWRSPNGEEVLWIATEAGVSRTIVGASRWQTASLMGGRGTGVFAALVEPDGDGGERLWVGASEDGIGLFDHGRWRMFTASGGALPEASVRMIKAAIDADGARTVYVGTQGGHLLSVAPGPTFPETDTPWPKDRGEAVLDIIGRRVDGHSEQWAALRQGGAYVRRDGGPWLASRAAQASGEWRVTRLIDQRDGDGHAWLWASTNQGLARFDGQHWTLFGRDSGLPDSDLIGGSLIEDAARRPVLWIGSSSAGVIRIDVSDPRHPKALANDFPPPPDLMSYGALADSKGRIYLCTNNGVQQLVPREGGYASEVFSRADGMINDECNTNSQFIDAHDRFWTGTLGGLTVYDPNRAHADAQPKPLRVVDVRVDGAPVEARDIHVPPSAKELDVTFALLSWQRESESRFRTELLGYDSAPGPWTAQNMRGFNALAPGRYMLRIEGRDYAGNVSGPIEVGIDIEAHWWQQSWARVLLAALLVLLGYAAMLLRTRALRAQRRTLEVRVASRTAELNAVNARLVELSYVDALTGLSNRRRLLETLDRSPAEDPIAVRTALIFIDVDYFKEYNDRFGHPAGDEALRVVAAELRRCAPKSALVARYGGEEFALLWQHADRDEAIACAERIRVAIAECAIPVPGSTLRMHVTISAGVACTIVAEPDDAHRLLRDADRALYEAKREGRDRVRAAVETS